VRFVEGDFLEALELEPDRFDLLVGNPPYVDPRTGATLAPEVVEHEPAAALFAPADDPDFWVRTLLERSSRWLAPRGRPARRARRWPGRPAPREPREVPPRSRGDRARPRDLGLARARRVAVRQRLQEGHDVVLLLVREAEVADLSALSAVSPAGFRIDEGNGYSGLGHKGVPRNRAYGSSRLKSITSPGTVVRFACCRSGRSP
jgi:hypothetical protein